MNIPAPCFRAFAAAMTVALLAACGSPREHFSVLPDGDGKTGRMVVTPRQGSPLTLDQANASATVRGGEAAPAKLGAAEIREMYKEALDAQPMAPARFVLYFVEGGDVLTAESQRELENVFAEIKKRPAPDLIVVGHTDRVGSVTDNDRLALRRAEKVRAQLIEQGFLAENISASGRGEREPLVATADEVAEARNRRVEMLVR
ncbi:MAG: OmpA family protein [Sulfuritalea sp.]|jgi:outer membrane protein OmpA-like peptidoglycan-associated protein|nr:OmpA family protein [Sulfuritalea sp.]